MTAKKKVRIGLIIGAISIIIAELILIAYNDFSWSKTLGPVLTIIGMVLLIIYLTYSIKNIKEKYEDACLHSRQQVDN